MRRGHTLVEVMVSSAIILALTAIVLGFMRSGIKNSANSQSQLTIQEQAYTAMHAMTKALSVSDIHSVRLSSPGTSGYICCLSAANNTGEMEYDTPGNNTLGHVTWQQYVVFYYTPVEMTLRVGRRPIVPPSPTPTPYRLNNFTPQYTDQVVANDVINFTATSPDGIIEPWHNPINLTLQCATTTKTNGMFVTTLTSSVIMDDSATTGQGAPLNDTFFNVLPAP